MKNKTLFIFSPAFPDEKESGWLPPVQVFIRALNRNFPEIKLIIFSFQYPCYTKQYAWEGNTVIPFNGMHKNKFERLVMWLRIISTCYFKQKNQNIIGILSLWCGECAFVAKYCAKLFSLKHFCWILGQDARSFNTYVKRIKPKAEVLVALSDFLRDEFYRSHNIQPGHVITNGIDTGMFGAMPSVKDIDIIGVGSLSPLKQYNIFIEIVDEAKKYLPSIKAMLCGDGEDVKNIQFMIREKDLSKHVELTGQLEQRQVLAMMQRTRIFLHPSSYEGFGTVCIEALYAGAHVISFCKPMHHNLKNWHVVSTKEEMLEKVIQMLTDKNLVFEPILIYSIDDSAKEMMKLFDYPFDEKEMNESSSTAFSKTNSAV